MSLCEKLIRELHGAFIGGLLDLDKFNRIAERYAKQRKPMKKFSGKGSRVGKLGIVRLVGEDLERLRRACFERDGWRCRECGIVLYWDGANGFRGEMAHIRTKRNNGDVLSNVRTLCPDCHRKEHNPKPCPPKVQP